MLIPRTRSLATGPAGRVAVLNGAHTLICGAKEKHFKPNGGSTGSWKMTENDGKLIIQQWNAMELTGFKIQLPSSCLLHFYSPTLLPACSLIFSDLTKPSRRSSRRASSEEQFFLSPRITKLISHLVLPHARALAEVPWGTGEVECGHSAQDQLEPVLAQVACLPSKTQTKV